MVPHLANYHRETSGMLRRAFVLLLGTLGLAACGSPDSGAPTVINQPPGQSSGGGSEGPIAILLPLSGKMAEIGRPMLRAAQLALSIPGSPILEVKDTGGTPDGAAQAAREAIESGAKMILGPVTSAETAQVAPAARRASVPVLAFTNDHSQAQPGVWVLGITPGQQVRRLLGAVRGSGGGQVAGILPDDDFGRAMADELTRIATADGQQAPFVRMIGPGKDEIVTAVNELAGLAGPDQPLPYSAILLGSTGPNLRVFAKAFADAKINRAKVHILGPALWVDPASGSSALPGAWFAMPDPDARRQLIKDYSAKFREAPPPRADLASDAASIARVLAANGKLNVSGLTQQAGFAGVDGWFALLPDGQVRRGLAVFRVERSRATKCSDAPTGPAAPAPPGS
jgi:branched-chain amino acid transport system substrate-binding protein